MFKDLKAIKGKYYIQRLIDEGEHEHQDFKFQVSDVHKIAHSLSAFANNDGGRLLVGVKDNGTIAGLRSEEDLYVLESAAQLYCRPAVELEMTTFLCEGGAVVLRAVIPRAQERPVRCREASGIWQAYYRVADENIVAHPLMVRAWERSASGMEGELLSVSEPESAMLRHLSTVQGATPEDLMRAVRLSLRSTENLIVRLAAMGLVTFRHTPSGFVMALNAD